MERPDQFRRLWQMQKVLDERIGVRTDGMNEENRTTSGPALERKVR